MGKIRFYMLAIAGAALLSPMATRAAVPIVLTPGSFNHDAVVEATAVDDPTTHYSNNITASMDAGTAKGGGVWYQQGLNLSAPTTGLPAPGVVVSAADPTTSYALQPYTGNNVRLLDTANATGTLTLVAPAPYSKLSFLTASGNGAGTLSLTVHFADAFANLTGLTVSSPDWFNNTPIAINTNGRVTASTGAFDNVNAGNPRLYQEDVTISGEAANHPISSIDVSFTGGTATHTAVFAVSGTPTPEPGCMGLIALAATALLGRRRR